MLGFRDVRSLLIKVAELSVCSSLASLPGTCGRCCFLALGPLPFARRWSWAGSQWASPPLLLGPGNGNQ